MEFFGDTVEQAIKAAVEGRRKVNLPSMGRRVPGRLESAESCREWMATVVRPAQCKVVALSFQIGAVARTFDNIDRAIERIGRDINRQWGEVFADQSPPSVPSGRGRRRRLDVLTSIVVQIVSAAPRIREIMDLKNEIRGLNRAIEDLESYSQEIERLKDQANDELRPLLSSNRFLLCSKHRSTAFPSRATCFADARRYGYVPQIPSGIHRAYWPNGGFI